MVGVADVIDAVPAIIVCAVLVAINAGGVGRCGLKDTAFSESCSVGLEVGKILVLLVAPAIGSRDDFDPMPLPRPSRLSDELLRVLVLIAVGLEKMDLYG